MATIDFADDLIDDSFHEPKGKPPQDIHAFIGAGFAKKNSVRHGNIYDMSALQEKVAQEKAQEQPGGVNHAYQLFSQEHSLKPSIMGGEFVGKRIFLVYAATLLSLSISLSYFAGHMANEKIAALQKQLVLSGTSIASLETKISDLNAAVSKLQKQSVYRVVEETLPPPKPIIPLDGANGFHGKARARHSAAGVLEKSGGKIGVISLTPVAVKP